MDYSVAVFCATYPGMFVSDAWPTSDKVVPWKVFWLMVGRVQNVLAMRSLHQLQATAQAIGMAFGGSDGRVQDALKRMTEQARGG